MPPEENQHEDSAAKQRREEQLWSHYKEVCGNIKGTDEISFRLLATVPLLSGIGSGALTLLEKGGLLQGLTKPAIILLSLAGAAITFGLFMWELSNIRKCRWYISRAGRIEETLFAGENEHMQFRGVASKSDLAATDIKGIKLVPLLKFSLNSAPYWGKTESEKLIYAAAVFAWLVPMGIALWG